jgi:glutamate-ammonia-ligase adenylyltransferase
MIEHSAAPALVATALDRLAEAHDGLGARLADDEGLARALVAVVGASRALTDLCIAEPLAIEVLADLDRRLPMAGAFESVDALRRWKRLELLRIAARDLLGFDDLATVGGALSAMAGDTLRVACALADAGAVAVIGMGKLGASELNYASDVDVVFVGGTDDEARRIMDVARRCFRVDADLRPEGRNGPLTRSLESYESYWQSWAQTWEFQALIKARPVAGDAALGARFAHEASARLWSREFGPDDLRAVRSMKARAEGELARRGLSDREIKRGRGGIRDIEFAVQLLQLVHGRDDPALRAPSTLAALEELANARYVDPEDALGLADAYRFLRTVEHRLQLVDEQQVHAVPAGGPGRERLARAMGYRDAADATALAAFDDDLRKHQSAARAIHERLFFRPLLDALVDTERRRGPALPAEAAESRLSAFGFTDAERTRLALQELTRGLTRSSRLMHQLLPLLLDWLSQAPDPDLGLLGLRRLAAGEQQSLELATAFRDSPEAARRLCLVLGTGKRLADTLTRNPDLIPALGDPDALAARSPETLADEVERALGWRQGVPARQAGLRRLKDREQLRIAVRDVLGLDGVGDASVAATGAQLTALAEATLRAALDVIGPSVPFAIVAMGRFGGAELSYASDLDALLVYDGTTAADFAAAEAAAETLLQFVRGPTGPARIYALDLDLRPEGKQGPLARSLDGYRSYYEQWAQTWERQALVRARPVAGDADVGRRFLELVEPHVWRPTLPDEDVREIRRMKARIERERIPPGDDPQFHLKLGRGSLSDIEWTAQLLQLRHGVREPGTVAALDRLAALGLLSPADHAVLTDAYRFCERTRNRWFLVRGAPSDSLPTQPEQLSRLARSLDVTPTELREGYRRVTRRARQVVQRLFYGQTA